MAATNSFWLGFLKEAGLVNPKNIKKLTKPVFTNLSHEAPKIVPKAKPVAAAASGAAKVESHGTLTYDKPWGDPKYTPPTPPARSPEQVKAVAQQKAQQLSQNRMENAVKGGYTEPQYERVKKTIGET